jgi:hypothetical protein
MLSLPNCASSGSVTSEGSSSTSQWFAEDEPENIDLVGTAPLEFGGAGARVSLAPSSAPSGVDSQRRLGSSLVYSKSSDPDRNDLKKLSLNVSQC